MSRRLLPYDEWSKLDNIVKACFGDDKVPPPIESLPVCAVEEDSAGDIVGFLFLQLIPHLEPFGSIGGASFSALRQTIDTALTDMPNMLYYLHTDSPESLEVYQSKGFKIKGILLEGSPNGAT